ncbi:acetyl-CoA synthetase-like protein [Trichoderma citrinoviride]|uniref:Acetyl-CoA synthetase-like protein n=1 Tax=Trichoderma citrinoviride TaxID=58853 RepID=A0A2T4AZ93_9HYPO|nr:acetyl-CoA synthetase-like protein [Trichoderma citrinoviride]PTB62383.1 acetyl-CoA synthetase-like protein [Trichoderma citrinoviride]
MAHQKDKPAAALAEIHGDPLTDLDQDLWDLFAASAAAHPDREALVSLWQPADTRLVSSEDDDAPAPAPAPSTSTARSECLRCSYGNLRRGAERLADALEKKMLGGVIEPDLGHGHGHGTEPGHGPGRGMHVAAVLWNCAEWGFLLWACVRIGAVFIPLDPRVTDDVPLMLETAAPRVLVVQDAEAARRLDADMARLELPRPLLRVFCGGSAEGWISLGELMGGDGDASSSSSSSPQGLGLGLGLDLEARGDTDDTGTGKDTDTDTDTNDDQQQGPPRPTGSGSDGDAPALVVFTSGTTGRPKGCPHTNRNLVSQTSNYDANADPDFVDRWLVHTPVCHVFAINNALRAWRHGGVVVFAARSFHIDATLRALVDEKCTVMSATPTLVRALLSHAAFPSPEALSLSIVSISGTMIGAEHIRLCREGLGARDAIQAYGMSEGAPIVSWSRQDGMLVDGYHAGVGKVLPGAAVRVCRWGGGREVLSRMEVGELHISGTSVIHGYFGEDEEDDDGRFYDDEAGRWLRTGDQAMIDEKGVVYILGRYNDLIIRGGENIDPLKIETALSDIPGLLQAFVVGVPDEIAGQIPVAIVKLAPKTPKSIIMEKSRLLGSHYALDSVYTLEDLGLDSVPATAIGKPKRAMLADIVTRKRQTDQAKHSQMHKNRDQVSMLEEQLGVIWDQLVGVRPNKTDDIFALADSITLLRYCDAILRGLGRRLYLQDLSRCATIETQARLLAARDAPLEADAALGKDGISHIHPRADGAFNSLIPRDQFHDSRQHQHQYSTVPNTTADAILSAAREQVERFGLDGADVQDVIPVRGSMYRTIVGQRPQSYRIRVVFRIHDATISQIYDGLFQWLAFRPLLRTVLLGVQGVLYHTVVRHSQLFFQKLVREVEADTEKHARDLYEDSSAESHSLAFMFGAVIIKVKETGQRLLCLTYSHSIADALTLLPWHRDLDRLIHDNDTIIPMQTSYRLFADLFAEYQDSLPAQRAVSFHVQRLRGISRYKKALWPKQLSPGMMIGSDSSSFFAAERDAVRDQIWNGEWQDRAQEFRFPRRSRIVRLPALAKLRELYRLEPVLFAKCALILFNVLQTKSPVAVFNSWESARSWPFVPDWVSDALQPAMSIDGPTVEWILNMYEAHREETLEDLIQRMVREQEQIRRHEHVPWEKVVQELREEASVAMDASFRQSFVWDVSMGVAASRGFRSDFESLEPVARYDWPDCGLFWSAFMVDRENLLFIASWDTAQLNAEQVDGYCDDLADVMRRLASEDNWGLKMGEVFPEY